MNAWVAVHLVCTNIRQGLHAFTSPRTLHTSRFMVSGHKESATSANLPECNTDPELLNRQQAIHDSSTRLLELQRTLLIASARHSRFLYTYASLGGCIGCERGSMPSIRTIFDPECGGGRRRGRQGASTLATTLPSV